VVDDGEHDMGRLATAKLRQVPTGHGYFCASPSELSGLLVVDLVEDIVAAPKCR
jgi:hypothetical protein